MLKYISKKNIVLIGMPGSGKTTIGRIIAEMYLLPFFDSDDYIEKKAGKSINSIFNSGEEHFRSLEGQAISELVKNPPVILSTGGGVVKSHECMKTLSSTGLIFFINRPVDQIIKDIKIEHRPLLREGNIKLYELYNERIELYKMYADYEIINDSNIDNAVTQITDAIERFLDN